MKISASNWTTVPNELFKLLSTMKESEMRVILVICRYTAGFHRRSVKMSLSKLEKLTGMSRQGVVNGIAFAKESGFLEIEHGDFQTSNVYSLNIDWEKEEVDNEDDQGSKPNVPKPSQPNLPPPVNQVDTRKERDLKETPPNKTPLPPGGNGGGGFSSAEKKKADLLDCTFHDRSIIPPNTRLQIMDKYSVDQIERAFNYYEVSLDEGSQIKNPLGFLFHALKNNLGGYIHG